MNHSAVLSNEPTFVEVPVQGENLTTLGIFISSLLLSLGSFFALTIEGYRRSRCTEIGVCCFECHRQPLPADIEADIVATN